MTRRVGCDGQRRDDRAARCGADDAERPGDDVETNLPPRPADRDLGSSRLPRTDGVHTALRTVRRDRQGVHHLLRMDDNVCHDDASHRVLDGDLHDGVDGDGVRQQDDWGVLIVLGDRQHRGIARNRAERWQAAGDDHRRRNSRIDLDDRAAGGVEHQEGLELVVRRARPAAAPAQRECTGQDEEAGKGSQPGNGGAGVRHGRIPDDIVLKKADAECCFGCCNKHLADFVEIKA